MSKYRFSGPPGSTTGAYNQSGYPTSVAGCDAVTANEGIFVDPSCCSVPKLCNWTTLPGVQALTAAGTVGAINVMTVISPIAQFFDIHAASLSVVNSVDCTQNGRALVKFVKFNTRNLEDYEFTGAATGGVLIDAAYMFDDPTAVKWMAGTPGNNQQLTIGLENICNFAVTVYAVFYGNPCETCPGWYGNGKG